MSINNEFSMKNNLKSIRERLGVSQAKMAALLGMSQGNISHCEQQIQEVSPDMARKIVSISRDLGVEVSFDDIYDVSEQAKAA